MTRAAMVSWLAATLICGVGWVLLSRDATNAARKESSEVGRSLGPLRTDHPWKRDRDAIAAVDAPIFVTELPVSASLAEGDKVLGVVHRGIAKAYPLWILTRREIVNDLFSGEAICVTYCPISASGVVFRSVVQGQSAVFGNDGALHEGNLVLYDRRTGSRWYQLRGVAIQGACAGQALEVLPSEVVTWGDWRRRHPEGHVLVGEQRAGRFFRVAEGLAPAMEGGASSGEVPPVSRLDSRLPARQRILGFRWSDGVLCFREEELLELPEGRYPVPGKAGLALARGRGSRMRLVDAEGGEWEGQGAFWFAWHAAFPMGELMGKPVRR